MATGINFLNQHRKKITKQQTRDQDWFKWITRLFLVVLILALVSVSSNLFLQYMLVRTQGTQKELEQAVLFQEDVEKSVVVLVKKLDILQQLISQRHDKQAGIEHFSNLLGDSVVVTGIDYAADEGILSLNVVVPSVFELERTINLLKQSSTTQKFSQVSTSQLRRDETGKYSVVITVVLSGAASQASVQTLPARPTTP